jgi:hypothetical protein
MTELEPTQAKPLTKAAAEKLDNQIRSLTGVLWSNADKLVELLTKARNGNIHEPLGFGSYVAWFASAVEVPAGISKQRREEIVMILKGEDTSISNRAIAEAIGVSRGTVNNIVAKNPPADPDKKTVGLDGKARKQPAKRQPKPKPEDAPEGAVCDPDGYVYSDADVPILPDVEPKKSDNRKMFDHKDEFATVCLRLEQASEALEELSRVVYRMDFFTESEKGILKGYMETYDEYIQVLSASAEGRTMDADLRALMEEK